MSYEIKYTGSFKKLNGTSCYFNILKKDKAPEWFLPSLDELQAMYTNLYLEGVGNFNTNAYWSASENVINYNTHATVLDFSTGNSSGSSKATGYMIRAIRSFTASVGDYSLRDTGPAGGLIFYIDGTTYYESSLVNQSNSQAWSNVTTATCGATATAVGTGYANTSKIVNQDGHTSSGALLANNYPYVIDIKPTEVAVRLSNEGVSMSPLNPICGVSITLSFVSETTLQFLEFMYAREREYKINYYETSVLKHSSFLLPEAYQQDYIAGPHRVSISGIDQLGSLRNYAYKKLSGNLITGWSDGGYASLIREGARIINAVNDSSGDWAEAYSNVFSVKAGETLTVTFNLVLNSGDGPTIYLSADGGDSAQSGVHSNEVVGVAGDNTFVLTPTEDIDEASLIFGNEFTGDWITNIISLEHDVLFRYGYETDSKIIANCLERTGLDLVIWENINLQTNLSKIKSNQDVFLELMTGDVTSFDKNFKFRAPIVSVEQTSRNKITREFEKYVLSKIEGQLTAWNCYDVLVSMLISYGARIVQRNGAWYITRIDNMRGSSTFRNYTKYGIYVTSTAINPIKTFTTATAASMIRPVNASGKLSCLPSWKKTTLVQKYGYTNLIINGSFEDNLLNWVEVNSIGYGITPRDEQSLCVRLAAGVGDGETATDPHLRYAFPLSVVSQVQLFRIKFDTRVLADASALSDGITTGLRIWVDNSAGTDQALQLYTTAEDEMQLDFISDAGNNEMLEIPILELDKWLTFDLVMYNVVSATGTLYIELHKHYTGGAGVISATFYDNIELWTIIDGENVPSEQRLDLALSADNSIEPEEVICHFGDGYSSGEGLPSVITDPYMYKGAKMIDLYDNGTYYPTTFWQNLGSNYTARRTLLGWLNEFMRIMHTRPLQIFRGEIMGDCDFISVYVDAANSSRLFFTNLVLDYDAVMNTWQVEAIELAKQPIEILLNYVDFNLELTLPVPAISSAAPSGPADVEVTSIATVDDGETATPMAVSFNYTNSGGTGNATIYWQIKDSTTATVDSGNETMSLATGSSNEALTGLEYPPIGTDYTIEVKETNDATWEVSNTFDVT